MEHFFYSYNNYTDDLSSIVYAIEKANIRYDIVVGVVRGGLVPAVHISHMLESTFVGLNWSSNVSRIRDKNNQVILDGLERNKKILVVDDICDSGVSLDDITKAYKGVDTAVLIQNEINERSFNPTYHGWKINRNKMPQWVDFWWEKK